MKKFVVIHTRPCLFRTAKNGYKEIDVFTEEFDHAIAAWRYYKELRDANLRDGRWPILSMEIKYE